MTKRPLIISTFVALTLAACSPWPHYGHGGVAEKHLTPILQRDYVPQSSLAHRLACNQNRLETLQRIGAESYAPADYHLADVQWTRTARTLTGELKRDAIKDMSVLEDMIERLSMTMAHQMRYQHSLKGIPGQEKHAKDQGNEEPAILEAPANRSPLLWNE